MRNYILIVTFAILLTFNLQAKHKFLQSGPMVGYCDFREVLLWAQTNHSAKVHFEYWDKSNPSKKYQTNSIITKKEDAFTAKCIADSVIHDTKYDYSLFINDEKVNFDYPTEFQTQQFWAYRKDPPNFKLVFGSGSFINDSTHDRAGKPYGGEYHIFQSIHKFKPDFMIWGGDNIYLRESDANTKTGINYRYTQVRSLPEMQPLLASTAHYAIWDDHDFGPNDSDRGFFNKTQTLEAFKLFWGNPSFGINNNPGTATMFSWGDIDFFLLDNRYYRTPNYVKTEKKTQLGSEQLQWLFDNLAYSKAPFKIIVMGGQFLNPLAEYENYSTYPEEKEYIIKKITDEKINGVVFLTGDRHFSELAKLERPGTYPLYDFTASAFTSGNHGGPPEKNELRVEGTFFNKRNFGVVEFSGKRKERIMTFRVIDSNGNQIWEKQFKENELK